MLILLSGLFLLSCEEKKEENLLSDSKLERPQLIVSNIRDVEVNTTFSVFAALKHGDMSKTAPVTVTLEGGNAGAILSGETEKYMTQGSVTFNDLEIDTGGRNYILQLTLNLDDEKISAKSSTFSVTYGDTKKDVPSGGSWVSIDMAELPAEITAGKALPDLVFTVKIFGNKVNFGKVELKVRDERENTLMVWRKPVLSARIKAGEAVFPTAFFTKELGAETKLIAEVAAIVGEKEFSLPRVKPPAVAVNMDSIVATDDSTEINASVLIDGAVCADCRIVSYLISDGEVKDAAETTTNTAGTFTARIADWSCTAGVPYTGAVKIVKNSEDYYALIHGMCG